MLRESYIEIYAVMQPVPAPCFSRIEAAIFGGAAVPGEGTQSVLKDYWFDQTEIEGLGASGAVQL